MELKMSALWPMLCFGLLFYSVYSFPADNDDVQNDDDTPKGPPPEIESKPLTVILEKGESSTLPCKIKNGRKTYPAWALVWTFNGSRTLFIDERKSISNEHFFDYELGPDSSLIIKNFTQDMAGLYRCVFNVADVIHTVGYKATVEIGHTPKEVETGSDLILSCKVSGYPTPNVEWYRKNFIGSRQTIGTTANITIPKVTLSDSGVYTCSASNSENQIPASRSIKVTVINGIKADTDNPDGVVYVTTGKNETLCCSITNSTKIKESSWTKDDKDITPLTANNRYKVSPFGKKKICLTVENVVDEDLGRFTCAVSNAKADIILSGRPAPPNLTSVTYDTNKTPRLEWKVKTYSPLLSYVLYYKNQGDENWMQLKYSSLITTDKEETISILVDDLPNGQYNFKLVVTNKYGSNEYIAPPDKLLVIDKSDGFFVMSEKSTDSGVSSNFRISFLCILFAVMTRLWNCY